MIRTFFSLLPLAAGLLAACPAAAQPQPGTDWPCVQRLVPEIAAAMIWPGPPLNSVGEGAASPSVRALAEELAARRVPLEDAQAMVEEFATSLAPDQKRETLSRLFVRTLAIINDDRASIVGGIKRFAVGQRALAERINQRNDEIAALASDQLLERERLSAERDWDIRVFDDRRASLGYLCEQPVLLEQRAFTLAREIAGAIQ